MIARHHHYLSQCYLKGFSKGGSKKSKLTVFDLVHLKEFETVPRNIGGIRDFNRIEADGVEPNALENSLSGFEREAASALKELTNGKEFEGEAKEIILNLIALMAVRSPERRAHFAKFETQVMESVMSLALGTKERWESQIEQMRKDGYDVSDSIAYEEIKKFHDNRDYTIKIAREHQIGLELSVLDSVFDCLSHRRWMLVRATTESGSFVTCDNPVNLIWKDPERIPLFLRQSSGFALKGTQVSFSVTKDLALIGEFDGQEGTYTGTKDLVATLNTGLIRNSIKQVFAPNHRFYFFGKNGKVISGNHLLRVLNS